MHTFLSVLAFHTADPGDHFRAAFENFRAAGRILTNPGGGSAPFAQWGAVGGGDILPLLLIGAVVFFLARGRGSGGKPRSSSSSSTGGGKLLPLGLIAVAAVVFFNGGV